MILRNEVSQDIENKRKPINSADRFGGYAENVWKVQSALEEAGIIFIDKDGAAGVGVRLRE